MTILFVKQITQLEWNFLEVMWYIPQNKISLKKYMINK